MENLDNKGKPGYNRDKYYEMMKEMYRVKKCFALIVLLLILIPTVCFAQTQEEWNLSCTWKTS